MKYIDLNFEGLNILRIHFSKHEIDVIWINTRKKVKKIVSHEIRCSNMN